jgi:hypothetical protein
MGGNWRRRRTPLKWFAELMDSREGMRSMGGDRVVGLRGSESVEDPLAALLGDRAGLIGQHHPGR